MPAGPRVRIVTGKGGVGKSAVAAALGVALAEQKKKVLICEVHGRDRIAALLQVAPTGPRMREVLENLWLVDMNAQEAIHEYALIILRFEAVYRAVFENRFVRSFLRLIPSLGELVMLGKVWFHEQEKNGELPRFDVIVVDAPATGHAISLLRTPAVVRETVPAGPLKQNAQAILDLVTSPELTRLHIVTTPEEMPVNEAAMLESAARHELNLPLGPLILNQAVEPLPGDVSKTLQGLEGSQELAGAAAALRQREQKRLAGEQHIGRLSEELRRDMVRLPRLVSDGFGLFEIRQLAALLSEVVR